MPEYGSLLHELSDADAVEYIEENLKIAKAKKAKDMRFNERYLLVYQALDPHELQITESSDKPEESEAIWANSYLPVAASRVDTHSEQTYNTIFSTADYLRYDPDNTEDDAAAIRISAHMMRTHRDSGFKKLIAETLLAMDCFDYAVTLTTWRFEAGRIPKRKVLTDTVDYGGVKLSNRRIKMDDEWVPDAIDRQESYLIPYFRCWHDWKATGRGRSGFDDSRFFFDEREEPLWVLLKSQQSDDNPLGRYKNIDKVKDALKKRAEDKLGKNIGTITDLELDAILENSLVTIRRCFTKFQTVEIAEGYVIRRQNTFDWPLNLWRCFTIPGKFRGMGLVQRVERMQYDVNADLNSRRNFWNMVLDPPTFMHDDLVNQTQGKEFRYGQTYTFDSERPIAELFLMAQPSVGAPPDAMGQLAAEIAIMDDVMKVSRPMQGRFASGRRTAAEAREVAAGGDIHYVASADKIEEGPLTRIYDIEFRLGQQFMTREARFKHYGQFATRSFRISPADYKLTGGGRFMALGARNKEDAIKNAQFFQGMQYSLMYPQYNNLKNIFKSMWMRLAPHEYQDFLADETINADNIPPEYEDQIMALGHVVKVSPANDHERHYREHSKYERSGDFQILPNEWKQNHMAHKEEHQAAMQQQAAQMMGVRETLMQSGEMGQPPGEERVSQGMSGPSFGAF